MRTLFAARRGKHIPPALQAPAFPHRAEQEQEEEEEAEVVACLWRDQQGQPGGRTVPAPGAPSHPPTALANLADDAHGCSGEGDEPGPPWAGHKPPWGMEELSLEINPSPARHEVPCAPAPVDQCPWAVLGAGGAGQS